MTNSILVCVCVWWGVGGVGVGWWVCVGWGVCVGGGGGGGVWRGEAGGC